MERGVSSWPDRLLLRLRRAAIGIQVREWAKYNRAEVAVRSIARIMVEQRRDVIGLVNMMANRKDREHKESERC